MKVYGRLSASLTIHIGRFSPGEWRMMPWP